MTDSVLYHSLFPISEFIERSKEELAPEAAVYQLTHLGECVSSNAMSLRSKQEARIEITGAQGLESSDLATLKLVLEEAPDAIESISQGYAVAIGFSFTGRPLKDGFCHIVTYKTHVNLGFNRGALLPNPNGVLAGTGKSIRHITIRNQNELERPVVRRYLQAAIEQVNTSPAKATREGN